MGEGREGKEGKGGGGEGGMNIKKEREKERIEPRKDRYIYHNEDKNPMPYTMKTNRSKIRESDCYLYDIYPPIPIYRLNMIAKTRQGKS